MEKIPKNNGKNLKRKIMINEHTGDPPIDGSKEIYCGMDTNKQNTHKKLLFGNSDDKIINCHQEDEGDPVGDECEVVEKTSVPNLLRRTRCYLIGHMQYSDGRGWRDIVKNSLGDKNITFFDPYHKPFVHEIPEDENARGEMDRWMETEQYDLVQQRMWHVRSHDLRLCDICDFFIAHLIPEKASWGSAEEITTVIRQKKPLFLSIEGGKKKTPLWLMGIMPHKYIYNNIDEIMQTVQYIDEGIIKMSSDRWKLLKPELR